MPVCISGNPVSVLDGLKLHKEYLKSQGNQKEGQKVFQRDSLEVSQLSKNREILIDKIKHTAVQSVTLFGDTRAEILEGVRQEKGRYDYSDVVNACGLSYARLYAKIEQRHKKEPYYKANGTLLNGWICSMNRKQRGRNPVPEQRPRGRPFRGKFLKYRQKSWKNWRTAFIRRKMPI